MDKSNQITQVVRIALKTIDLRIRIWDLPDRRKKRNERTVEGEDERGSEAS
jgi:hypothetical protein